MASSFVKRGRSVLICASVISLVIMNSSCKHGGSYAKEVKTMDSLSVELRKSDSIMAKVDSATISKDCNHVMMAVDFVKMAHKDSMSAGAVDIFKNINQVRWKLETFLGRRNVIRGEIKKSLAQLSTLSHDMSNGLIKADSVNIYYGFEEKRAKELVEAVQFGMADLHSQLPLYGMIVPQMDSLITRLKNHQGI